MLWTIEQKVSWLLCQPWRVRAHREEDGSFFARVEGLPGAVADGADEHELESNFWPSLRDTLRAYLEAGDDVPLPAPRALPWLRETTGARRGVRMTISGAGVEKVVDLPTPFSGTRVTA